MRHFSYRTPLRAANSPQRRLCLFGFTHPRISWHYNDRKAPNADKIVPRNAALVSFAPPPHRKAFRVGRCTLLSLFQLSQCVRAYEAYERQRRAARVASDFLFRRVPAVSLRARDEQRAESGGRAAAAAADEGAAGEET